MFPGQLVRPFVAAFLLARLALAGGVTIAERPQLGQFATIQAGIDAALEGESLLVAPGTYAPFTIDGKSVRMFVTASGQATISGQVVVRNLSAAQHVLLTGLTVNGPGNTVPVPALDVASVLGQLRVENCTFRGQNYVVNSTECGMGARVTSSLNVVFSSCTLEGGSGGLASGEAPGDGGSGIVSVNASIALYDCTLKGGGGSDESYPRGGNGGHGYSGVSYGVFASGTTFRGGTAGGGDFAGCNPGGTGGDGLRIDAGQAHLLEAITTAGTGGWSSCGPASPAGQAIRALNGSIIDPMTGNRRKLSMASIAADDTSVPITITGIPGDTVYLMLGRRPSFLWKLAHNGVWLVPTPLLGNSQPAGTIDASGTLVVQRMFDVVSPSLPLATFWLQALCVRPNGEVVLSGPEQVLSLNAECLPDCNANGRQDLIDIVLGGSLDTNGNVIPDECEAQQLTWYVDAAAPPGGNGSAGLPFQNLLSAVTASVGGDTIVLADGVYQGASNRSLDLNGRDLTIRSANGLGNCMIDCQLLGRAFSMNLGETVVMEGLRIVSGKRSSAGERGGAIEATNADLTLRNCRFEACTSRSGGAVGSIGGILRLEDCEFTSNTAPFTSSTGGAVSVTGGTLEARDCLFWLNTGGNGGAVFVSSGTLRVRDCRLRSNTAERGGAFWTQNSTTAVFTHCDFLQNHANVDGGAGRSLTSGELRLDDCLLAGNSAATNGGAIADGVPLTVASSTFVSNSAGGRGGSIYFNSGAPHVCANTIARGGSAPTGAEFCVSASTTVVTISYCDIQGGQAGVAITSGAILWGAGNVDLDPLFEDPDGPDNSATTYFDNDYGLSAFSPCIDAGGNGAISPDWLDIDGDGNVTEETPLDFRHQPRRIDVISVPDAGAGTAPIVDMGAIERQG